MPKMASTPVGACVVQSVDAPLMSVVTINDVQGERYDSELPNEFS